MTRPAAKMSTIPITAAADPRTFPAVPAERRAPALPPKMSESSELTTAKTMAAARAVTSSGPRSAL